jgi:hypothetical protein
MFYNFETRSVEKTLEPLVLQVTTLVSSSTTGEASISVRLMFDLSHSWRHDTQHDIQYSNT